MGKFNKLITAALAAVITLGTNWRDKFKDKTNIHEFDLTYKPPPPPRKPQRHSENEEARQNGIPTWLRRYAKRYGNQDVAGILQMQRKYAPRKSANG